VRRVLPAVLAAVVVATVGCSLDADDVADPTDPSPLTPAEIGWIRAYAILTIAIYDDDLGPPAGPRLVETCRQRVEELGPPPTDRLERAAQLTAEVCPLLARRGEHRRALDTIDDADDLLRPLLLDERPLDLREGVTHESRADTALSSVASRGAGRPVEVRCWSEDDWRRLVEEENAWTAAGDDADELFGWADESADRIYMRLEQCNTMSRLRTQGFPSEGREARREAADSIGTLAHEIQHFRSEDDDEAEVECAGVSSLETVARRVGLDPAAARAAAEVYRTEIYPDLPAEYVGDCPAAR
jgi:hypothetical protein